DVDDGVCRYYGDDYCIRISGFISTIECSPVFRPKPPPKVRNVWYRPKSETSETGRNPPKLGENPPKLDENLQN
ncbi:10094_t:CDS:1, partial [Dentiscutata heterogama]